MATLLRKTSFSRFFVVAGLVVAIGGLASGLLYRAWRASDGEPVARLADPTVAAPAVLATEVPVKAMAPRFDVVRVSPQGDMVIAGRGEPGSEVIIREGANELARATVDRRGEFVALSTSPIGPGGKELTLSARVAGGGEVKAEASVVLAIPQQSAGNSPVSELGATPVPAIMVPQAAAPQLLMAGRVPAPVGGGALALDTVDYDDKGAIQFKGGAVAGSTVRVYVDNGAVGDGRADTSGRWTLTPEAIVSPGMHRLRVDQLDRSGRVMRRVELPFQRAVVTAAELAGGRVVVQPGQNLWRLARAAYGRGVRYTVIYLANRDQIRDARLIYPGQAFSVPAP